MPTCVQVVKTRIKKGFLERVDGHCQRNCQPGGGLKPNPPPTVVGLAEIVPAGAAPGGDVQNAGKAVDDFVKQCAARFVAVQDTLSLHWAWRRP
jgi:hypothetical protein